MAITESRYITINDKIITKDDVQKLARIIYAIYSRRKNSDKYANLRFVINCEKEVSFTSSDLGIFSEDSPITSKKVQEIEMRYSSNDKETVIHLRHGSSDYKNSTIKVEGHNSTWVNGTLKKLEEVVDGFEPQSKIIRKYGNYVYYALNVFLLLFVSNKVILFLLNNVFKTKILKPDTALLLILFSFVLMVFISLPIYLLLTKLREAHEDLYPSVELQLGPEYKLKEKRKRFLIYEILIVVIIPVIL